MLKLLQTTKAAYSTAIYSSHHLPRLANERKRKRMGRGGQGATAGKGRKGWKGRHGGGRVVPAFEGGQTSIIKAFRKFGIQKREK